jgi:hypothetical protein
MDDLDVNKLFYAMIAGDVSGQDSNVQMQAPAHKRQAYFAAAKATRQFHQIINDPKSSYETIQNALKSRSSATINFENAFGLKWPL